MNPAPFSLRCALLAVALAAGGVSGTVRAEVQIERIFLPHGASPSSFAIGLPGGVNFCWDPLRAAVSYVWTGGFLDVSPARPGAGKFIRPANLLGDLVYRETGDAPLRRGAPDRVPAVEFLGYTLHDDAVEFRYAIDGIPVREEIRTSPDGQALMRRLLVAGGTDARWWHVLEGAPPSELRPDATGARVLSLPLRRPAP